MGYRLALEAAGAKVLGYGEFGDWQGSWLAKVEYKNETGWIEGSFGSCSYCDAFEGEFGYYHEEESDYQERLKRFGEGYLGVITPQAQQEAYYERALDGEPWDFDDTKAMYDFVKELS
jgi:hypothetical protein